MCKFRGGLGRLAKMLRQHNAGTQNDIVHGSEPQVRCWHSTPTTNQENPYDVSDVIHATYEASLFPGRMKTRAGAHTVTFSLFEFPLWYDLVMMGWKNCAQLKCLSFLWNATLSLFHLLSLISNHNQTNLSFLSTQCCSCPFPVILEMSISMTVGTTSFA